MPFTYRWLNEDEDIFVVKYTGRWTWEEVRQVDTEARQRYGVRQGRFDAICDFSSSAWVPPYYVENVRMLNEIADPNLCMSVFIAGQVMNDLIRTFDTQFQSFPYKIAFAGNMADAVELILRDREQDDPNSG